MRPLLAFLLAAPVLAAPVPPEEKPKRCNALTECGKMKVFNYTDHCPGFCLIWIGRTVWTLPMERGNLFTHRVISPAKLQRRGFIEYNGRRIGWKFSGKSPP